MVEGQRYSPQYYENLKQKFNVKPPPSEKWKYHWQGPGSRCWCHNRLDRPNDICELCKKEYEHLQLLSNVPEEKSTTPTAINLTILQQQQIITLLKQNDNLFAMISHNWDIPKLRTIIYQLKYQFLLDKELIV